MDAQARKEELKKTLENGAAQLKNLHQQIGQIKVVMLKAKGALEEVERNIAANEEKGDEG